MNQQSMLEGFALYREPDKATTSPQDHTIIGTPLGTRLKRLIRLPHGWRLWLSTTDYRYGTYLELFDDGRILNCTTRPDEGDEVFWVRPSDDAIKQG
jgi:hypothetical protein